MPAQSSIPATSTKRRSGGRKSNGEGTVYFVASEGRWRASYYDLDGKRRTLTRKTRKDADIALRDALHARDTGTLGAAPGSIPTLGEWLERWLTSRHDKVRYKTHLYQAQRARSLPEHLLRRRIDQLRPVHFEDLYRVLQRDRGLSVSTIRGTHSVLSQSLERAVRWGLLLRNPLDHVDLPRAERIEIEPLTLAETRRVLDAASLRGEAARWQLALLYGMRQGEVLGLRWQDLDLESKTLTVRQQLQRQGAAGLVLVPPKSRAGNRVLQIGDQTVAALTEHRKQQVRWRLRLGAAWTDQDFVFTTASGTPVDPRNDARKWHSLLREAGVRKVRLHDARHTAATLYLSSGAHVRVLMEVLGHSQISLTLNTYAHVAAPDMRAATEALEASLRA